MRTPPRVALSPLVPLATLLALAAGCAVERAPAPDAARVVELAQSHTHADAITLQAPVQLAEAGRLTLTRAVPFQQLGLMFNTAADAARAPSMRARARRLNGTWTPWLPLEITWSEGAHHVGRLLLSDTADTVELDLADASTITWAHAEFHATHQVTHDTLTRTLPRVVATGTRTRTQAIAPRSLVIPRAEWGARNPDKICNDVVAPYRASIHHTASPDSDGDDPAARMRQMQAFHIDTRGWCDIGYHFVVSQSGLVYQGRSDERRPGAHVGDQNPGNIGVSFIGNYEVSEPPQAQLDAAVKLLAWIKQTYPDIPWNRESIRGHREWPGQSTGCPGTNLLAKLPDLLSRAAAEAGGGNNNNNNMMGGVPVTLAASVAGEDRHAQGQSQGVVDLLPGEEAELSITLRNGSDSPLRNVLVGYTVDTSYLEPLTYTIYTDAPAKDGATWMVNDADMAAENPAKDALGAKGQLTLYAFGAGESKRVTIKVRAKAYSVGLARPAVRAWVQNIDDLYTQSGWDQAPAVNNVGATLQSAGPVDVLSRDAWFWDSGDGEDTESWTSCGDVSMLSQNTEDGLMSMHVDGDASCVQSPSWTSVNAGVWDQLVLTTRAHDGAHEVALAWQRDGEEAWHAASFEAAGDGSLQELVIPLATHPEWHGKITALRLFPRFRSAPAADAKGWYGFGALSFQASGTQRAGSTRATFLELTPVPISRVSLDTTDTPDTPSNPDPETTPTTATVNSGCATTPAGAPGAIPVFVMFLYLAALVRRRRI